jgi:hypothetical protein
MIRVARFLVLSLSFAVGSAYAQDADDTEDDWDDIDLLDGEEEEEEDVEPDFVFDDDDDVDLLDDDEDVDLDDFEDLDDDSDFLDLEDELVPDLQVEGQDSPTIYRQAQNEFEEYGADEEVMAWEQYLQQYPNSLFVETIARHIEELMREQYDSRIERTGSGLGDAADRELLFDSPLNMENINPRSRLHLALEWGLPNWANVRIDGEYAILRTLSIHGGFNRRAVGFGFELGPRWALVKSARTNTIVSVAGDIRLNFSPTFLHFRPNISAGRIFGDFQIMGQAGVDIEARSRGGVRLFGGLYTAYRVAPTIAVFLETNLQVKNLGREKGPFTFDTVSFGMKFFPKFANKSSNPLEVNAGASIPAITNYWQYHFGSIMLQGNYFAD